MNAFYKRSVDQIEARRISPDDSNYFVLLFDEKDGETSCVAVVEIFTVGGKTPPNTHKAADELFFVLSGQGRALCNGQATELRKGDALLVKPGSEHIVENTGDTKLYTLTVMVPDEKFGALIRRGTPVSLDDEDRAVLCG